MKVLGMKLPGLRMALAVLVAALPATFALAAADSAPATQASTSPSGEADFEVQEWLILQCDPTQNQANARAIFDNTLPEFIGTRRPAAKEEARNVPQPIGVIRLIGKADPARRIDVLLELKGGTFVAHWPKTQPRVNRLLWRNLVMSDAAPGAVQAMPKGHWLGAMRDGSSAWLDSDRGGDRFLLYDVELPYKAPVRLELPEGAAPTTAPAGGAASPAATTAPLPAPSGYRVSNTGSAPLLDVTVYRPAPGGAWMSGQVDAIPGTRAAGASTTAPATAAANGAIAPSATAPATQVSAATHPATGAAQASTQPAGRAAAVSLSPVQSIETMLEPWRKKLSDAGLAPNDFDLILSILRQQLNSRHATLVYRLDPGELDRLLPLEVVPSPRRVTRVALVIVRNIDPALDIEIDRLIALLGNDDWSVREQAQKDLAAFGAAAQPKLQAAMKSKDLEIVYRAEQLIRRLAQPNAAAGR